MNTVESQPDMIETAVLKELLLYGIDAKLHAILPERVFLMFDSTTGSQLEQKALTRRGLQEVMFGLMAAAPKDVVYKFTLTLINGKSIVVVGTSPEAGLEAAGYDASRLKRVITAIETDYENPVKITYEKATSRPSEPVNLALKYAVDPV